MVNRQSQNQFALNVEKSVLGHIQEQELKIELIQGLVGRAHLRRVII